jgi:hypothetical protein
MKAFFSIFCICLFVSHISCKKDKADESSAKHCWQLLDFNGNQVGQVCDKTEAELLECIGNNTCGNFLGSNTITTCNYYQIDGEKFCYQIGSNITPDPITESQAKLIAKCYYGNATLTKLDCVACKFWYTREKKQKKPAGNITYSPVYKRNYCGDTLNVIFQGKQVIRKDDADSLIIIQFSNNGQNW